MHYLTKDKTQVKSKVVSPEIKINTDTVHGAFQDRVEEAIDLNRRNNVPMYHTVQINAHHDKEYCFTYHPEGLTMVLNFKKASIFKGFEHTIEDIAKAIALPLRVYPW